MLELPAVGGDPVHHGAQLHHRVRGLEGAQQLRARDEPKKLRQVFSWIADEADVKMTVGEEIAG